VWNSLSQPRQWQCVSTKSGSSPAPPPPAPQPPPLPALPWRPSSDKLSDLVLKRGFEFMTWSKRGKSERAREINAHLPRWTRPPAAEAKAKAPGGAWDDGRSTEDEWPFRRDSNVVNSRCKKSERGVKESVSSSSSSRSCGQVGHLLGR